MKRDPLLTAAMIMLATAIGALYPVAGSAFFHRTFSPAVWRGCAVAGLVAITFVYALAVAAAIAAGRGKR